MENTDKLAQNLQTISTVYKKWLPKLAQHFDDIPYHRRDTLFSRFFHVGFIAVSL